MTTFRHSEAMGEISGFGGRYEEVCQNMLEAGCQWLQDNDHDDLQMSEISNVFGLLTAENEQAKALEEAVMAAPGAEDASGAMHHAVMRRLHYISKYGWGAYISSTYASNR